MQQAAGQPATVSSRVTNLPRQEAFGQRVTPQEMEAFGQRRVRFIRSDDQGVAEIAEQVGNSMTPQSKDPPNYIIRLPIHDGAIWTTTWETNQFGKRTLLPMTKTVESADRPCAVAAETVRNCLQLRLTGSGMVSHDSGAAIVDVIGEEWFAPGVGYVEGRFSESVQGLPQQDVRVEVTLTSTTP